MSLSNATWQRSIDLAGEIKQARAIIDECAGACLRSAALHEADRVSLDRANERHQALLDERADPEGCVFDAATFAEGEAERERIVRRLESLGFIRQPRSGPSARTLREQDLEALLPKDSK